MNIAELQTHLDIVKWHESENNGMDMCRHMPYCDYCKGEEEYPCALAYERMEKANEAKVKAETKAKAPAKKAPAKKAPAKKAAAPKKAEVKGTAPEAEAPKAEVKAEAPKAEAKPAAEKAKAPAKKAAAKTAKK